MSVKRVFLFLNKWPTILITKLNQNCLKKVDIKTLARMRSRARFTFHGVFSKKKQFSCKSWLHSIGLATLATYQRVLKGQRIQTVKRNAQVRKSARTVTSDEDV